MGISSPMDASRNAFNISPGFDVPDPLLSSGLPSDLSYESNTLDTTTATAKKTSASSNASWPSARPFTLPHNRPGLQDDASPEFVYGVQDGARNCTAR